MIYRALQLIQIFCAHGRTGERANEGNPRGPRGPKKLILAHITDLILVIFKLPVLFHGGRGEEIEEGVCLHLKPDKVSFNKIGSNFLKVDGGGTRMQTRTKQLEQTSLVIFLGETPLFPFFPPRVFT